jgi:hypothetical protein
MGALIPVVLARHGCFQLRTRFPADGEGLPAGHVFETTPLPHLKPATGWAFDRTTMKFTFALTFHFS